jgi:hypothetical protein
MAQSTGAPPSPQLTVPCNPNSITNVPAGTSGFVPVGNSTYHFLGGVNTWASTYLQPAGTFLCLLGSNGAVLKPPAASLMISQGTNASLLLGDLIIDGGTDAVTGEKGPGPAHPSVSIQCLRVALGSLQCMVLELSTT